MSDWNRGREEELRRYRDEERAWSARDREDDAATREARSFDDRNRTDWREGERGRYQGSQSYGGYDAPRYGQGYGQAYGPQDPRGHRVRDFGSSQEAYRTRDYASQAYGDPAYGGQGYAAYRRPQAQQGYGEGRAYGQDRRRWDRERSDFLGTNEILRRQEDGETDQQLWSSLGRGEHRGRGPKNYTRSDDRIREDVNDRLSDDDWLDATEIEVQVSACEVTLNGTVSDRNDRRRAEDIAEQVSGVKHVQNNLRVDQASSSSAAAANRTSAVTGGATPTRGSGSNLS